MSAGSNPPSLRGALPPDDNRSRRGGRWRVREGARTVGSAVFRHLKQHAGAGIVCAVAYFDPGNWGVDLQAGSEFGYRLLFVVLLAGVFAVFLQTLASRLGCVTGLDLASHCRLLLHSRPKHTLLYRWLGLYPLYVLSEVAIIATDLAELLGSAIALSMLFPRLELWHGVLITALDVVILLAMGDPLRGRPVRFFEILISVLVLAVLICMLVIISKVDVHWGDAFEGFLPSKYIFRSNGIYLSIGILGATVMPHSLFLGSALATQDRLTSDHSGQFQKTLARLCDPDKLSQISEDSEEGQQQRIHEPSSSPSPRLCFWRLLMSFKNYLVSAFRAPPPSEYATRATRHADVENNPVEFIRAHIYHGTVDIVGSLLGFAVLINALILILAGAVFYYGSNGRGSEPASLFDAYDLIKSVVGKGAATLFAIALLSAGQSSSIIATVAGQAVSEGFLQWRISVASRRIVTRLIAMIPSMVVAIAVGRSGVDTLLVVSQVVLSIVLPFITFPLIYLTSSREIMNARPASRSTAGGAGGAGGGTLFVSTSSTESKVSVREVLPVENAQKQDEEETTSQRRQVGVQDLESAEDEVVDFSNGRITATIGYAICLVVLAANVYVIVSLGMHKGG